MNRSLTPPAPSAHRPTGLHGFTLIEVLVVLAIVGVLMAVLLPNLTGARRSAKSKAAQQYGQNVFLALNSFTSSRPGLTGASLVAITGWPSGPALPAASGVVASGGLKDCTAGYTLTGGVSNPQITVAVGGSETGALTSWGASNEPSVRCAVTTASPSNPYAINVYTWSDQSPERVYTNGKQN